MTTWSGSYGADNTLEDCDETYVTPEDVINDRAGGKKLFEYTSFLGLDLGGVDFTDCTFFRCAFLGASFSRSTILTGARFECCNLAGMLAEETDFSGVRQLTNCTFEGADLRYSVFTNLELCYARFTHANLYCALFEGCNLSNANFRLAYCEGTRFNQATLEGTDFGEAHVAGASFNGAALDKASHEVMSAILVRAARHDYNTATLVDECRAAYRRLSFALLVGAMTNACWGDFGQALAMLNGPELEADIAWYKATLAPWSELGLRGWIATGERYLRLAQRALEQAKEDGATEVLTLNGLRSRATSFELQQQQDEWDRAFAPNGGDYPEDDEDDDPWREDEDEDEDTSEADAQAEDAMLNSEAWHNPLAYGQPMPTPVSSPPTSTPPTIPALPAPLIVPATVNAADAAAVADYFFMVAAGDSALGISTENGACNCIMHRGRRLVEQRHAALEHQRFAAN